MAKKTGLGKGLDALFSSPVLEEKIESNEVVDQVKYLKINEIEPNKEQARKIFDEEAIEELSNSIKEYGVIFKGFIDKIMYLEKFGNTYYSIAFNDSNLTRKQWNEISNVVKEQLKLSVLLADKQGNILEL